MQSKNYPEFDHEISFQNENGKMIFVDALNRKIAEVTVETETDEYQDNMGKLHYAPKRSFRLVFKSLMSDEKCSVRVPL
jgi:hypothetical protein